MPADYDQIRTENIGRYGWDTAVLDLLGRLYSDRTHFIFELLQNAEDADATELSFELFEDRLEVRHDGRPFNARDVRGVCGVGEGTKAANDLTQIGKFGIGFKSVYAYTRNPRIHSDGENFRIDSYVRPFPVEPVGGLGSGTLFVFPFDRDEPSSAVAIQEISSALAGIEPATLLFLRKIQRVRIRGVRTRDTVLERKAASETSAGRHIMLAKQSDESRHEEEWLAWQRPLGALGHPDQRVEIAFRLEAGNGQRRVIPAGSSPLVVFFPTQKETFLGFLAQGPYRTTPARDNVPEHDPWNQDLAGETATLVSEVLSHLRDDGLLTVDALQAMPLGASRFGPGSMFHGVFDVVRTALLTEQLILDAEGGYCAAKELNLARGAGLRELLSPEQLWQLYGTRKPGSAASRRMSFAHHSITQDRAPELWRYLREELGVEEVTPQNLVSRVTGGFLQAQTDEWIAGFYEFLHQNPATWRTARHSGDQPGPARAKPIIRLEDGTHISPFDSAGQPAAYLPGPVHTARPTVRRVVADFPEAREFLEALGLSVPDAIAEVLDNVLPRYEGLDAQNLDRTQHLADIECIALALSQAPSDRRDHLREQLQNTSFLVGENPVTGKQRLMRPAELYQRTAPLEMYFDGNPDAWFLSPRYEPWLEVLRGLGVRQHVAVNARRPDLFGIVALPDCEKLHERGIDGFDPAATIDGLGFALDHPNSARSEYVWNFLLAPNRHLVAGVVENSRSLGFKHAKYRTTTSAIGAAASASAWLPGPDGSFHRPGELRLGALPPAYRRDEGLARSLGMVQPFVDKASRELNVPARVLLALSQDPDLVEMVEKKLADGPAGNGTEQGGDADQAPSPEAAEKIDYAAELSAAFKRHASRPSNADLDDPGPGELTDDPEPRISKIQAAIEEDLEHEPPLQERFRLVPRKVWDAKDSAVRHYLFEEYKGRCQICKDAFDKRDRTPYFEGLYLVARRHGQWLDRPGNVIALCATCCAKFQHGTVEADIIPQIQRWRTRPRGEQGGCLAVRLCGKDVQLGFTEKHLIELLAIINVSQLGRIDGESLQTVHASSDA